MTICHTAPGARFIPIPKNASTSIIKAMFGLTGTVEEIHRTKPVQQADWQPEGDPTFAVIRNPWQRLQSAWRNKVFEPRKPDTSLLRLGADKGLFLGMPFEAFVESVAEHGTAAFDRHIYPQHWFLPMTESGTVHEAVRFLKHERLDRDWRDAGLEKLFGPLDYLNRSGTHPRMSDRLFIKIWDLYYQDAELWFQLRGGDRETFRQGLTA